MRWPCGSGLNNLRRNLPISWKETFPRYGITTTFVDVDNLEEVEGSIGDNTKLVLIETLGDPLD